MKEDVLYLMVEMWHIITVGTTIDDCMDSRMACPADVSHKTVGLWQKAKSHRTVVNGSVASG
jgi:hypothetical protein